MYQRKRNRRLWTEEEDELLQETVATHGTKWVKVAQLMSNNRNGSQCSQRWKKITCIKTQTRWTPQEDFLLLNYQYQDHRLRQLLPDRTTKQIKERYINVLDPNITRERFTKEEDSLFWNYTKDIGRKWTLISGLLPGRPENMIKNRFYSYILEEYGQEDKPYLVTYRNGKKTYKKKISKSQLRQKKSQLCYQSESTVVFDRDESPTYFSCVEDQMSEESQQYSFYVLS